MGWLGDQGCQMVYFQTNLGIFYGHLVYFSPFWYVVPKKSGNPVAYHWNLVRRSPQGVISGAKWEEQNGYVSKYVNK
jgi:hypothetical protein